MAPTDHSPTGASIMCPNHALRPARILEIISPAGLERYFERAPTATSQEEGEVLAARYGLGPVPDWLIGDLKARYSLQLLGEDHRPMQPTRGEMRRSLIRSDAVAVRWLARSQVKRRVDVAVEDVLDHPSLTSAAGRPAHVRSTRRRSGGANDRSDYIEIA